MSLLALVLAAASLVPIDEEGAERWMLVELPSGFHLDLATGAVHSQPKSETGTLSYESGRVTSTPRLVGWEGAGAERVASKVARVGGRPLDRIKPAPGEEWIFDLGGEQWGYLRVVDRSQAALRLEYARAASSEDAFLEREPKHVEVGRADGHVRLEWLTEPGATYSVRRAYLSDEAPLFEVIDRVSAGEWTDPVLTRGVVSEYRIARVDRGPGFGTSVRALGEHLPGEWAIPLQKGARIDLLTGDTNAVDPDVEITYVQAPNVQVRPLGSARLTMLSAAQWILPLANTSLYTDSIRSIRMEGALAAYLKEGIYVRLSIDRDREGNLQLFRQFDLSGSRVLPLAPRLNESSWSEAGAQFSFLPIEAKAPDADTLALVCERELGYETRNWEEVARTRPGQRELTIAPAAQAAAVQRYRFRHAYPWGSSSLPSDPVRLIQLDTSDGSAVETLLDDAFADLLADDFDRRVAAYGLLGALGEVAWPRLRAALASDDPELVAAAREILLSAESSGDHVELVLRSRAIEEGVEGDAPPGLFAAESSERAFALLRAFANAPGDEARARFLAWSRVLTRADPDPVVGSLATLLIEQPLPLAPPPDVQFPVLWPPSERVRPSERNWREFFERRPAQDEVLEAVRTALDTADLQSTLALLQVVQLLQPGATGDLDTAELALRLIERFREEENSALLEAAVGLTGAPGQRLHAFAELCDLRLARAAPGRPEPGRVRHELEGPSFEALQVLIDSLRGEEGEYTDIVLPPGTYGAQEDSRSTWLNCSVDGLRLIGGPGVELRVGLRIQSAKDVVVEGIALRNDVSSALMLHRASATIANCTITGADTAVSIQEGEAEFIDVRIEPSRGQRPTNWSIRMNGDVLVLMRDSHVASGTVSLGPDAVFYAERSVFDVGERIGIQGNRGGEANLRNCVLRSSAAGLSYLGSGVFDRVVFDVREIVSGPLDEAVYFCPDHIAVHFAESGLAPENLLDVCPIDRR